MNLPSNSGEKKDVEQGKKKQKKIQEKQETPQNKKDDDQETKRTHHALNKTSTIPTYGQEIPSIHKQTHSHYFFPHQQENVEELLQGEKPRWWIVDCGLCMLYSPSCYKL